MGNGSSSARGNHDDTVDFGFTVPQGVYTGQRDWDQPIVAQLITQRKLAPFYRPLEEYDESWGDEQILAARKGLPEHPEAVNHSDTPHAVSSSKHDVSSSFRSHGKRPSTQKEVPKFTEATIYRGAVECPICFLYYPANINYSRCCDQAICTECFVQIKRSEPTTTNLKSEPAACPYCVRDSFGVVYEPPPWRDGAAVDGSLSSSDPSKGVSGDVVTRSRRRTSFSPGDPKVVAIDHIRPDWEKKLATVQAQAQRRANRRIIMRQVGDRLIPVGVTSGRVHALTEDGGDAEGSRSGNRRRRRNQGQNSAHNQLLGEGQMDMGGQELEELMMIEAMRLSLIEHEEQQRREEERNRRNGESSQRQRPSSMTPVRERNDHRPSSSVPNNNSQEGLHGNGDWRDRPQSSTLTAAINATNMSVIPSPSSITQTGGTDGDSATISSESSGTGHSSTWPATDAVERDVDYASLPSSPDSPGQSRSLPARTVDNEVVAGSRTRTPE